MPFVVNAKTTAEVNELKLCETSTSQPLSCVEQHRQTLSASHQWLSIHHQMAWFMQKSMCMREQFPEVIYSVLQNVNNFKFHNYVTIRPINNDCTPSTAKASKTLAKLLLYYNRLNKVTLLWKVSDRCVFFNLNKNLAIANRSRVSCINTNNNIMTLKSSLEVTQCHW